MKADFFKCIFYFNWSEVKFKFKSVVTTSKFIKFDNSNLSHIDEPDSCDTNLDRNRIKKKLKIFEYFLHAGQNNFARGICKIR